MADTSNRAPIERRAMVREVLRDRGDMLVVAGLGSAIWDAEAAGETPLNFYLLGAMGSVVPTALGLAIAQPSRRVLALTGDAELLMGLGCLPTVGLRRPGNLAIVVIDNGRFGETGSQVSHTAHATDLAGIARASGIAAETVDDADELPRLRRLVHDGEGLILANVRVGAEMPPVVMPIRDGATGARLFRRTLLGEAALKE